MRHIKLFGFIQGKEKSHVVKNSFWGVIANITQNLLFSVFFIVVARKYNTNDFASYVIANALYAFMLAFSSLGLGQWFIREFISTKDPQQLVNKFFKLQIYSGIVFFVLNIIVCQLLYTDELIRRLSFILGVNIIFDNIIYVITHVNIARLQQRKTFMVLTVEAVIKFGIACLLFFSTLSISQLVIVLVALRFFTLNFFLRGGSSFPVSIKSILKVNVHRNELVKLLTANWYFIVIGSISVLYWRIGNIMVSKNLALSDVNNYEISYKLFSMAQILPFIVSTSVYPLLINASKSGADHLKKVYKKLFVVYTLYGLAAYTFVVAFSDLLIPFLFGKTYAVTPAFCKEMFLTMLVFPTLLLQANILITLKLERLDMWMNVISLGVNIILCLVGLMFFKSLSVVTYSIFISILVFHLIQDHVLVKKGITSGLQSFSFYALTTIGVLLFNYLASFNDPRYVFCFFWLVLILLIFSFTNKAYQEKLRFRFDAAIRRIL